jgi:hypothetical protein
MCLRSSVDSVLTRLPVGGEYYGVKHMSESVHTLVLRHHPFIC